MDLNKILSLPHTSCKTCLFAEYEGDVQLSCKNDLFDKLKLNGAKVIEAEDHEKKFNVVVGRKCLNYRSPEWGKDYLEEDWQDVVSVENKISYDVIIYIPKTFDNQDMLHLKCIVNDILEQEPQPNTISVCEHFSKASDAEIIKVMEDMVGGADIKWMFQRIVDGSISTRTDAIEQSIPKLDSPYYGVFNVDHRITPDFFYGISKAIYRDLKRFSILLPDSKGNGYVSSTKLFKAITTSIDYKNNIKEYLGYENPFMEFIRQNIAKDSKMVCSYKDFCGGRFNV